MSNGIRLHPLKPKLDAQYPVRNAGRDASLTEEKPDDSDRQALSRVLDNFSVPDDAGREVRARQALAEYARMSGETLPVRRQSRSAATGETFQGIHELMAHLQSDAPMAEGQTLGETLEMVEFTTSDKCEVQDSQLTEKLPGSVAMPRHNVAGPDIPARFLNDEALNIPSELNSDVRLTSRAWSKHASSVYSGYSGAFRR